MAVACDALVEKRGERPAEVTGVEASSSVDPRLSVGIVLYEPTVNFYRNISHGQGVSEL